MLLTKTVDVPKQAENATGAGDVVATVNSEELVRADFDVQLEQAQQTYLRARRGFKRCSTC